MADDLGFQPLQQEAPAADDIGFKPIPKAPDMSGVQKTAQSNLATNDNGEEKSPLSPQKRLDVAVGAPVQNLLNPKDNTPVPAGMRKNLTRAYADGSAVDAGDFFQSAFHSMLPIVAGALQRGMHPIDTFGEEGGSVVESAKGGAGLLMYPFLSEESKQELLKNQQLTEYQNPEAPTAQEIHRRGLELEQATVGKAMGGLYSPLSILSPIISPIIESAGGEKPKEGEPPTFRSNLPGDIGVAMDILGGLGMAHGAGELRASRKPFSAGGGPWDNLPGKDILADHIAKKNDIPVSEVTPDHIEQHIAEGVGHKAPSAADFKAVETVTNGVLPEEATHNIYNETGVKPDQVFEDAQRNPQMVVDISSGKIPEQYQHLVEPKPVLPPEEAAVLHVAHDEATRSYKVVDRDGDHVQGGFDSAEEARHYIEDERFRAEERRLSEEESNVTPRTEAEVGGQEPAAAGAELSTKGYLFDQAIKQAESTTKARNIIPPSEVGRPTSLRSFLSNNGAKFNEDNELVSIKKNNERIKGKAALEYAHEISKEHGYLPKDEEGKVARPLTDLQNSLTENGGRKSFRDADADRIAKQREALESRKNLDPVQLEHEANNLGLDTERPSGESEKQFIARLRKQLEDFYKGEQGSGETYRKIIGDTISAVEKYTGKLTGGFFEKLGDAYTKTFQPELMGPLAKRADAFMAKYKAAAQEAENAFYRQFSDLIRSWDKKSIDQRMEWIDDHETGRWNEEEDADHAMFQSLLDETFKNEKEAIGADAEKGYKENYLPLQFADEAAVKRFFNSDAMIKKYGADWFTKARTFDLIQDAVRAGFKLKTDNPGRMLVSRLLAGDSMIRTMDLLKDMESSGIATRSTTFSIEKKIAKTQAAITDLEKKYQSAFDKANNPKQERMEGVPHAESKLMQTVKARLDELYKRLDEFVKEQEANKISPERMKEIKGGLRIIGPDSKAWNIHPEAVALWRNAMEIKGLYERQGIVGDAYRAYTQGKSIWTQVKLGLSLFHPIHVAMIDLASDIAATAEHLIHGGSLSELATKKTAPNLGLTKETLQGQDHPAIQAWNTPSETRTPEQQKMVQTMVEGGFKPTMSARDTIHFRENFDKAVAKVGLNNLRLIGTVLSLPGLVMKPFFEHWIPGMKAEIYLQRCEDAIKRDPSLAEDAGRRGEVFRQIAKDTDRTYGEMNNDVQFWNRNVRDAFNASFISGGWKLAQIYNARGLLQPAKIAYKFAKTGEFSKDDITFNMLHAYAYTALTLALGGAINKMLGNPIGTAKDTVWDIVKNLVAPQTGEKNPDGTPIRLNQPAFAKEAYSLAHEINTKGILGGAGSFLYHQTLMPGIMDTLNNRDFTGRKLISDATDLHQWMSAGWDTIMPISYSNSAKAEQKHSEIGKIAGPLGFPFAGAYLNQTPFEQKVLYTYDEQTPPKEDVYSQKLKADLKTAIAKGDTKSQEDIEHRMKEEGMTERQIENAKKPFTKKFVNVAWEKLSTQDQKRLIESASDEEKKTFKVRQ